MKRRTIQFATLVVALLAAISVEIGTADADEPRRADGSAYELCIEHSPVKAGTVNPMIGTHRFNANSVVTLSAVPLPGYEFAYWIGDVSDPTSRQTTVRVDTAKIVVAVFRFAQEDGIDRKLALGGGGGPTKLIGSLADLKGPGFGISGGPAPRPVPVPVPPPTAPTPEPTTVLLLGLGGLVLRRKRR